MEENAPIIKRLGKVAFPEIPSVWDLSIVDEPPAFGRPMSFKREPSPGLVDPLIERARILQAFPDFKPLSDAYLKTLSLGEKKNAEIHSRRDADELVALKAGIPEGERQIEWEREYTRSLISRLYHLDGEIVSAAEEMPEASVPTKAPERYSATLRYVEGLWPKLFKKAPERPTGSILETPYPFLIAAGRFKEGYYWDLYTAVRAMIATGRLKAAQMQAENLLHMVWRFGFDPNGWRDYYLGRSQPPFLSSMVREVYAATAAVGPESQSRATDWLKRRAVPLLGEEYRFWMAGPRVDKNTGLNHHWDDINAARQERFGADDELALGETYRDTRAAAESGRDFTDAWTRRATKITGPLLNGMLYKTEMDIADLLRITGDHAQATQFLERAERRQNAMNQYLWNERLGAYVNYDFVYKKQIEILGADTAYPLFAGVPSQEQARRIGDALQTLERPGGIMSSALVDSMHQWDGNHGWAPDQFVAVEGAARYGMDDQANRIALNFSDALAIIHDRYGNLPESVDVARRDRPKVDDTKYPVQEGFLWTNSVFILFLKRLYCR